MHHEIDKLLTSDSTRPVTAFKSPFFTPHTIPDILTTTTHSLLLTVIEKENLQENTFKKKT